MDKNRKKVFSENRKADPDNPYDGCVEDGCSGKYDWDFHYKNYVCGTCGFVYDAFVHTYVKEVEKDGEKIKVVKKRYVPSKFNKRDDGGSEFPSQKGLYRKLSQIDSKTRRHNSWSKNQRDKEFNKDFYGASIEEYWNAHSDGLSELEKCKLVLEMEKHFMIREDVITEALYERGRFTTGSRSVRSYHIMEEKGTWIKKMWKNFTKDYDINCRLFLIAENILKVSDIVKEHWADVSRILGFYDIVKNGNRYVSDYKKIIENKLLLSTIDKFDTDGRFSTYYELFESCEELSKLSGGLITPRIFSNYIFEKKKNTNTLESVYKYNEYKISKDVFKIVRGKCFSVTELKKRIGVSKSSIKGAVNILSECGMVNTYKDISLVSCGAEFDSPTTNRYVFLLDDLSIFEKIPNFNIIKTALDNGFVRVKYFQSLSKFGYEPSRSRFNKLGKSGFLYLKSRRSGKWFPTEKSKLFYESVKDGTFKGFDWLDSLKL
jgi:hypothetical protein